MSFLQCLGLLLFFVIMLPALDLHLTFFGFRFYLEPRWSVFSPTLLRHCGMSRISFLSLRRVSVSIYNRHGLNESPPKTKVINYCWDKRAKSLCRRPLPPPWFGGGDHLCPYERKLVGSLVPRPPITGDLPQIRGGSTDWLWAFIAVINTFRSLK